MIDRWIDRKIDRWEKKKKFKELAYAIVRAGKSEICRADWKAGNSGRV